MLKDPKESLLKMVDILRNTDERLKINGNLVDKNGCMCALGAYLKNEHPDLFIKIQDVTNFNGSDIAYDLVKSDGIDASKIWSLNDGMIPDLDTEEPKGEYGFGDIAGIIERNLDHFALNESEQDLHSKMYKRRMGIEN